MLLLSLAGIAFQLGPTAPDRLRKFRATVPAVLDSQSRCIDGIGPVYRNGPIFSDAFDSDRYSMSLRMFCASIRQKLINRRLHIAFCALHRNETPTGDVVEAEFVRQWKPSLFEFVPDKKRFPGNTSTVQLHRRGTLRYIPGPSHSHSYFLCAIRHTFF